jgi:hypothetical protein
MREASCPGGRLRCAIPNEVRVSTTEPGSSASTLAYRAAHRDVSCGPSSKTVKTTVGPTARMTSASSSLTARSWHTSETIVISSPTVTKCSDRGGISIASHHRTCG